MRAGGGEGGGEEGSTREDWAIVGGVPHPPHNYRAYPYPPPQKHARTPPQPHTRVLSIRPPPRYLGATPLLVDRGAVEGKLRNGVPDPGRPLALLGILEERGDGGDRIRDM